MMVFGVLPLVAVALVHNQTVDADQTSVMADVIHVLSSSDDDDIESLPDLRTRLMPMLVPTLQKQLDTHTLRLSSNEDDTNDKDCKLVDVEPLGINEKSKQPAVPVTSYDSEEELPDILDFTVTTSHSQISAEEDIEMVEDTNFKYVAKRLLVEEVHKEKETRRKQREIEKQRKAIEKAEAKARREAEKKMKHALKPGECMKYVIVQLDRQLLELAEGSQVISHLQNADLRYRVVDSPVAATTTILRVDPLTLQETLAEEAVVVMALNEFLDLVKHQVYEGGLGLCQRYCEWKQRLGNANITLVVCGIDAYFRNEKMGRQHDFRSAVLGETAKPVRKKKPGKVLHCTSAVHVSRVDIEMVLVNAQLECGLNHRFMSDSTKVATFILQFTKAVAETPFKREKGQPLFSWYAEGNREATVKVDRSGVGLLKLWHQQLRQFNNVGVEVAQAIAREYPSPQALVQAYRKCQTHREASLLLADISVRRQAGPLVSTRRVGPELSKKIHVFFTTRDPEITLG